MKVYFDFGKYCIGRVAYSFVLLLIAAGSLLGANTTKYGYDSAGRLTQVDFSNGQRIDYAYDRAGNLLSRSIVSFIDSDSDGLDDEWEIKYFGDLSRNSQGDSDGDGQSDLREFLAGTNPTDRNSVFQIVAVERGVNGFQLRFSSVAGKRYQVEFKDSLSDPAWKQRDTLEGTGGTVAWTDLEVRTQRFYRILLLR